MTEKVVLTKEQAEAIRIGIADYGSDVLIDNHSDIKLTGRLSILDEMPTSKLARAIFRGFEVETEFKVGDFIEIELFGRGVVVEITGINNADGRIRINGSSELNEYNVIRKLTDEEVQQEKERRWWRKHGRDVLEFKTNDIVSYDCNAWGGIYTVYSDIYSWDSFKNRLIKVSNRHMHNGRVLSFRADKLKVMCFAENRLDVSE